jgi:hypothetical protein
MTKKGYTSIEFSRLTQEEQLEILQKEGVFIGKHDVGGFDTILYQLNGFYAEITYLEYRKSIQSLVVSNDSACLQPYLDQIRLSGLDNVSD